MAYYAYEAMQKPDETEFHRYIINGLVASILESGDGKTAATAFDVVSIEEEYTASDTYRD